MALDFLSKNVLGSSRRQLVYIYLLKYNDWKWLIYNLGEKAASLEKIITSPSLNKTQTNHDAIEGIIFSMNQK